MHFLCDNQRRNNQRFSIRFVCVSTSLVVHVDCPLGVLGEIPTTDRMTSTPFRQGGGPFLLHFLSFVGP